MKHFNAKNVKEAVSLLDEYREEAKIIAGGVDLVHLLKNRVLMPKTLVDIKTIHGLSYIKEDAQGLKIGPLTTLSEVEKSAIIKEKYPMIAQASRAVGAPQLRNMATIGGNLGQEVQCWYYRRSPITGISFFCSRKGGKSCYALSGENAYHSIFGGEKCWAVCPSDLAPALVALDATLKITSLSGERMVAVSEFYSSLGTILKPDEMLTEIQIPAPAHGTRQQYLKFRLRKAIDFAISSVAAAIIVESGVVNHAKIVLGSVAPAPYRALKAEEILRGEEVTDGVAEASASAATSEAFPLSGNLYKIPITQSLVRKVIEEGLMPHRRV